MYVLVSEKGYGSRGRPVLVFDSREMAEATGREMLNRWVSALYVAFAARLVEDGQEVASSIFPGCPPEPGRLVVYDVAEGLVEGDPSDALREPISPGAVRLEGVFDLHLAAHYAKIAIPSFNDDEAMAAAKMAERIWLQTNKYRDEG